MSRGAPPTTPISAVPNQVTQQLAATGQVSNQQAAIRQKEAQSRMQGQLQRERMNLARQQGMASNAVQMAAIGERSRSQAEYRDLLRDKAEMENQIAKDSMSQRKMQFDEEMAFKTRKYDEMLAMRDEELEARIAADRAEGAAREMQLRKADQLARQRSALAIQLQSAEEMMRTGREDLSDIMDKVRTSAEEQLMNTQIATDRISSGVSDSFGKDRILGREGMQELFGVDMGRLQEALRNIGMFGEPMRYFFDDPNARQTEILKALGEDFVDVEGMSPPSAMTLTNIVSRLRGDSSPVNLKEQLHKKVAKQIAEGMGGLDEAARGTLEQGLLNAFNATGDNASSVKAGQEVLAKVAQDAGVDMLVLNTAIAGAGNLLRQKYEGTLGTGEDTYANIDDLDEMVGGERFVEAFGDQVSAFDAFVLRKLFSQDNISNITALGNGGETTESLRTFVEELGATTGREGFSTSALRDLLEGTDFDPEGEGDLLRELDQYGGLEDRVEDILRQQRLGGIEDEDLLNRQQIEADVAALAGGLDADEEMLRRRRARRTR